MPLGTAAALTLESLEVGNLEVTPLLPTPSAQAASDLQQWYLHIESIYGDIPSPDIDEDTSLVIHNSTEAGQAEHLILAWNPERVLNSEFGPLGLVDEHRTFIKFRKHPDNPPGLLTFGENVALFLDAVDAQGWLYVSPTYQKVYLSFRPVYQWSFTGGHTGTNVKPYLSVSPQPPYDIVGIYNAVRQDYLIYCAGNIARLGWAQNCFTDDPTDDPMDDSTPPGGSTIRCGIDTCESHEHAIEFIHEADCLGSGWNATECASNTGSSFNQCSIGGCPNGYHSTSFQYALECDLGGFARNQTTCNVNTSSFDTCGSCPAGYTTTSRQFNPACSPTDAPGSVTPNEVHCQ
jgi:hypothetical protein